MRKIYIDENLDGQTLEGPSRQSYFYNCSLSGTIFLGEWEGSDFINCSGDGPDWTGSDIYAGYWRGCNFTNAKYPSSIGHYHHEPVADILSNFIISNDLYDAGLQATMIGSVANAVRNDYNSGSWIPSYLMLKEDGLFEDEEYGLLIFTDVFNEFDDLIRRFERLASLTIHGGQREFTPEVNYATIKWPNSTAEVYVDGDNLPQGINPGDRYSLSRWIEQEANAMNPSVDHHCFLLTIVPMRPWPLPSENHWLTVRRKGY